MGSPLPLIVHVVYRFSVGGLENGVVNLINRLPRDRWRHAIVSLTDVDPCFAARMTRDDVQMFELNKGAGHAFPLYPKLFRLFRALRPAIVHTRNLAALEAAVPAWFARVPVRLHGEHGWDIGDVDGENMTYRLVRRAHRPFIDHYVALSRGIERYLEDAVYVRPSRVTRISNGVDVERFTPSQARAQAPGSPFGDPRLRVIGTVGRLEPVKNQTLLAAAFLRALDKAPQLRSRLRLAIVGDGALRAPIADMLARAGISDLAWLPGARDDIPGVMRAFDVFVLPSLAEGISNTILEAMATGLPVVATRVGGNAELVEDGRTGMLVDAGDVEALAHALLRYADVDVACVAGLAGRVRATTLYSLETMVASYASLYERLMTEHRSPAVAASPPASPSITTGSH